LLKLGECGLNCLDQHARLVWLRKPAEGLGLLRPHAGSRVMMGGCEEAADAAIPIQLESGVDTVAQTGEADIHNNEIRPLRVRELNRLSSRNGEANHFEAGIEQSRFDVHCDQMIVFDDKYPSTAKLFLRTAALSPREHGVWRAPPPSGQLNLAGILNYRRIVHWSAVRVS
jgi:hypothetical protein